MLIPNLETATGLLGTEYILPYMSTIYAALRRTTLCCLISLVMELSFPIVLVYMSDWQRGRMQIDRNTAAGDWANFPLLFIMDRRDVTKSQVNGVLTFGWSTYVFTKHACTAHAVRRTGVCLRV